MWHTLSVASFNHIPAHLRDDQQSDWTPELGLRRGALFAALASLALASVMGATGYLLPFLTQGLVLNLASGFLIAFTLLSVTQKTAGMFDLRCTLIAICAVIPPLVANQFGIVLHVAASTEISFTNALATQDLAVMVFSNFPAYLGTGVAAWLCRNGDFSIFELADLLMINPLTGRRA